jgi:cytochrome c peroxidase
MHHTLIYTLQRSAYCFISAALLSACGGGSGGTSATANALNGTLSAAAVADNTAELGRRIFNDRALSEPRGTACISCHQPAQGFAGNHGSQIGVALGSQPGALGLRNAMTNSYAGLIPPFSFVTQNGETEAVGGLFWDGRADTPAQQALGPLLNPLEMNNPSKQTVVSKIAAAAYAPLFRQVFGANILNDTDLAFTQIGVAIAAFERASLQTFTSKYDAMVRGQTTLTDSEARGMVLFIDPLRGNCAACHSMNPASSNPQDSLFTDFSYYATGVPRNTLIPQNADPAFFDLGLCGPNRTPPTLPADATLGLTTDNFCGKFRMPTLRNVAQRTAFMHNGYFGNLRDVVRFYSTRISNPVVWYGARVNSNDLPAQYLANIETAKAPFNRTALQGALLTEAEITDVVAFLGTLSDGFANP